ncbi:iron-containing alcohol dehydrogenase [Agrobacterium vitis]|uniref:Maleylacetate reductase n=1 Tax=Agrobacterium vitis TaxID=373 RepID=A0AAE2UVN1_AGRVI|nr:maleylacetate reductase [Agrobacterium vitis]MBF2714109.1 maleylacetate reductase [Agrobacterium vitis]MUO81488.1 iron-containing alcohol dehydrogenase [Agrobacterium vitis]MUO95865.1 iron-containing alcohol dehydrogenase [Agrobacterium vitis]MVA93944.1 iron-containing alcohol dehydrogenase [Agrobacterium vitis]MVB03549.1 iron-containing alcohol dehydrogenase [Agrobacterium vitis]
MIRRFSYAGSPAQIVFGAGSRNSVAEWIGKAGCRRALVLSTPHQRADAEALAVEIGPLACGVFAGAVMHTPVDVTETAMKVAADMRADCVVSLGGGSTIGLGKAIAYRTDLPQIVVPTTYAGSEVTPILGQTEAGRKTTVRDAKILPEIVIYDPTMTYGLPVSLSVTSGLNAMAHAIEALYARDRNPISSLMALEGLSAFKRSLPVIAESPEDADARGDALYGAWLCGSVLGTVGMALHHKICHTLGGSFDLPHAETHAVMLPHTAAFNAAAAAPELAAAAAIFGGSLGGGLWDFARAIGAPLSLKQFGLREEDLDRAAGIAVENPYWNPRPIDRDSIRQLLQDVWQGQRPAG